MAKQEALKVAKPILFNTEDVQTTQDGTKTVKRQVIKEQHQWNLDILTDIFACIEPPYCVGDIFYVRETWAKVSDWVDVDPEVGILDGWIYKADWIDEVNHPKWRPSIHMPKEAARIFLRVTNVHIERLKDITLEQANKEGCKNPIRFDELWDSTVKKSDLDKYGWDANPWVWVIEFERLEVTI